MNMTTHPDGMVVILLDPGEKVVVYPANPAATGLKTSWRDSGSPQSTVEAHLLNRKTVKEA